MKDLILQSLKEGIEQYEAALNGNFEYMAIPLDCTKLPSSDKLPEEVKSYFFAPLHRKYEDDKEINRRTCLYIIEFSQPEQDTIEDAYRRFRLSNSGRSVSTIKTNTGQPTSTLYVGKVKKEIGGRMVTHLGYNPSAVGGLQLAHWAPSIGLQLMIHVYIFERSFGDFVNPLELSLTKHLHPLIGNSK